MPEQYRREHEPLTTWLKPDQRARFEALAKAYKVTPAALARAIIVDVLAEGNYTLSAFVPPVGRTQYRAHLKVGTK